jgi:hypothetical protein
MRVAGCNAARWPRPGFTFSRRSAAHPEAGAAVERRVVTRSAWESWVHIGCTNNPGPHSRARRAFHRCVRTFGRSSWVPPLEIYRQISAAPTWTFNLNIRTLPGHVHRVFYVLPVVGGMGPWTGESGFPFGEFQQADTLACARFSLFDWISRAAMAGLLVVGSILAALRAGPVDANNRWALAKPDQERIDGNALTALFSDMATDPHKDLKGIVVLRHGKSVAESYFNGDAAKTLHDIRSAAKRVTALRAGIAIDRRRFGEPWDSCPYDTNNCYYRSGEDRTNDTKRCTPRY